MAAQTLSGKDVFWKRTTTQSLSLYKLRELNNFISQFAAEALQKQQLGLKSIAIKQHHFPTSTSMNTSSDVTLTEAPAVLLDESRHAVTLVASVGVATPREVGAPVPAQHLAFVDVCKYVHRDIRQR